MIRGENASNLVDENDIQDNGEIIDEESPTKVRRYFEKFWVYIRGNVFQVQRISKTEELDENENSGRFDFDWL